MFGAIEAGGTKFVCAVSENNLTIVDRIIIPTKTPEETMMKVFEFFDRYNLMAIGIGSFGPIDIDKTSSTYGFITNTPKKNWYFFDLVGALKKRYSLPMFWTTDVNAAAYGEYKMGSARNNTSCLYITVGTGVGGGAVLNGKFIEGYCHPEMGHLLIRKHAQDNFAGICPFHDDCLEGLASGPAIETRCGISSKEVPENHETWNLVADYLAQAVMTYTLVLRMDKVILGGGVMRQGQLLEKIQKKFHKMMNNYLETPNLDEYIVTPELHDNAGIIGCLLLAEKIYHNG